MIGAISPLLYGQFTERIGGVIYDGVWVGRNSAIPNLDGIRTALLGRLRKMRVPIIRSPGGQAPGAHEFLGGRSRRCVCASPSLPVDLLRLAFPAASVSSIDMNLA